MDAARAVKADQVSKDELQVLSLKSLKKEFKVTRTQEVLMYWNSRDPKVVQPWGQASATYTHTAV